MSEADEKIENVKFDCPVCYEILLPPIFQCCYGHLVCKSCVKRVWHCPMCRVGLRDCKSFIRNLAAEKVVLTQSFPCPYDARGCKDIIRARALEKHKTECVYKPVYYCPALGFTDCKEEVGLSELIPHLKDAHGMSGESLKEGDCLEVCQIGSTERKSLEWSPNFIQQDNILFFLKTKMTRREISWMISFLDDSNEQNAKDYVAKMTLVDDNDEETSIKWKGPVVDFWKTFEGRNCFTVPLSHIQGTSEWKLQVAIPRKGRTKMANKGDLRKFVLRSEGKEVAQRLRKRDFHVGVYCDGCQEPVSGLRFKCVTCTDYDLCKRCAIDNRTHSEHLLLLMPLPNTTTKLQRAIRSLEGDNYNGGVRCDACETSVTGLWFMCTQCHEYDLCEGCCLDRKVHNHHLFLMSTSPEIDDRRKNSMITAMGMVTALGRVDLGNDFSPDDSDNED